MTDRCHILQVIIMTMIEQEEEILKVENLYISDIKEILSHRYDNGADLWATSDKKLLKGAPFTTLESISYLLELGVLPDEPILQAATELLFSTLQDDGRFKIYPKGGIYPCQTARVLNTLCYLGLASDNRLKKSFQHFFDTQQTDGGWKCNKYSFGHGEETEYSTPNTTLIVLDAFRHTQFLNTEPQLDKAVDFLLQHWVIRKPISPCHYGIGTLFMQISYPFRDYNLFYYLYVLSFYNSAKNDTRFLEALEVLKGKIIDGQIVVERVVPKLSKLSFCRKGQPSELATLKYQEILENISK